MKKPEADIKETLKKLRIEQFLSIQKLASISGVSASHISRIESGKRKASSLTLEQLAPHLQVNHLYLLKVAGLLNSKNSDYVDLEQALEDKRCIVSGIELTSNQKQRCLDFLKNCRPD